MYINIIHHKNIHPRIPLITLVLKYICNLFKFYDMYYFVINILYTFNVFIICWIFKKIDQIKFKVNQIYLKQTKITQDVMSIHYQKNYTCDYNFLGLSVFSPRPFQLGLLG
jgi:hypothetical protein